MAVWENGGRVAPPAPGDVSSGFRASSEYGMRFHPIDKVWRLHAGIDVIGFSVVCAPEAGLLRTTYAGGYGNLASVFAAGAEHRLAHNARFLASDRSHVTAGQPIAIMGTTGASTGIHCHHEIYVHGRSVNPRDYMASAAGGGSNPFPGGGDMPLDATDHNWLNNMGQSIINQLRESIAAVPAGVWGTLLQAQDAAGNVLYVAADGQPTTKITDKPLMFKASGFVASTNGRVGTVALTETQIVQVANVIADRLSGVTGTSPEQTRVIVGEAVTAALDALVLKAVPNGG